MHAIRKRISEELALLLILVGLPIGCVSIPFILWKLPVYLKTKWSSVRIFPLRLGLLIYCFWCWTMDRVKSARGGRIVHAFRNCFLWDYWRSYFDMEVVHESSKESFDSRNLYIFGVHPHGILSVASWGNFIARNEKALPDDLDYRVLTVSINFKIPFWREFVMGSGLVDASRSSARYLLKNGISIVLIVGGASEALDSRPKSFDLTLEHRKGFIKMALEHGAFLVPVFSFGETDIFEQIIENPSGSFIRKIQERLKSIFGYSLPLVWGRLSGLPYRRKITTIIGKPIPVPKLDNPSAKEVDYYHKIYKQSLVEIYEKYQGKFYPVTHEKLRIIDESKL